MNLRPAVWLLLLAIPASHAQVLDPQSEVTVTLTGAPDTLTAGGNATVGITVRLEIMNIVCPGPQDVSVDLAVTPTPSVPGVTANLLETSLDYTVTTPPGQSRYQGEESTELNIELGPSVMNATQDYVVTATFAGGAVCTSQGGVPEAENEAAFTMGTQAAPPMVDPEDEEGGGGGGGGGGGIPGPGVPLTVLGVIALVAFLRRR